MDSEYSEHKRIVHDTSASSEPEVKLEPVVIAGEGQGAINWGQPIKRLQVLRVDSR